MERLGDQIVWGPIFKRNLNELEESQFHSMMALIASVYIYSLEWKRQKNLDGFNRWFLLGVIFFLYLTRNTVARHTHLVGLWKSKASPRVAGFGWSALVGGILTMDNLCWQCTVVINACPKCLVDAKSIDHLLLNCRSAQF